MQIEMGKGNQMGNNAFSYMQNQLSVLIIKVYVFETFKAVDKDVYRALFGSEGKSVNDTMAEISPAQIEEIDVNNSGKEVTAANRIPPIKAPEIFVFLSKAST